MVPMLAYTPPPGTYDQPFIWVFDASSLVSGNDYQNLQIYLKGGLGDFVLREVLGLKPLLNATAGQYHIQDYNGSYIEQFPVFGQGADQIGIVPELKYKEQGQIRFDLFDIA